eukprot:gene18235-14385_t
MLALVLIVAASSTSTPTPSSRSSAPRPVLSVTDFGAKADGVTNNQKAIFAAMKECESKGGCELHFPLPTTTARTGAAAARVVAAAAEREGGRETRGVNAFGPAVTAASSDNPVPLLTQPYGPAVKAVYTTSAFNLTSHLKLVVPAGVQIRGTEDFADNCGGSNTSTCDDHDSPAWPVLPWP